MNINTPKHRKKNSGSPNDQTSPLSIPPLIRPSESQVTSPDSRKDIADASSDASSTVKRSKIKKVVYGEPFLSQKSVQKSGRKGQKAFSINELTVARRCSSSTSETNSSQSRGKQKKRAVRKAQMKGSSRNEASKKKKKRRAKSCRVTTQTRNLHQSDTNRETPPPSPKSSLTTARSQRNEADAYDRLEVETAKSERFSSSTIIERIFVEFASQSNSLSLPELSRQFDSLGDVTENLCQIGMGEKNCLLNRYSNIFCVDESRVVLRFLSSELGSEYIHANYVNHPSLLNKFILTQGPLSRTVGDMWRMIWQEKASFIVMLCRNVENRKKKSADYLPDRLNDPMVLYPGTDYELHVTLKERYPANNNEVLFSKCVVKHHGKEHIVTHCQWKNWPDCLPPQATSPIPFVLLGYCRNAKGCSVVHCSAGVGRSGTLVAVEMCLMEIIHGNSPSVVAIVRSLRRCRAHSVQTFEQFCFIYRSILQFGVDNKLISAKEFENFSHLYDSITLAPSLSIPIDHNV